ncbi:hypothetical protein [Methylosinus sp. sav-2]|uniref:hypothetical protein n=1 Tax=Methylosinus sp. sav-2 TaxID=2485168 RepID=UPI000479F4C0|nr:hypothetical protein [Methylosinus sp. sav-2]
MTMLRAFIMIFIVSIFVREVRAEEFGCELVWRGYPFTVVRNGDGNEIAYTMSSANSRWELQPFGYHTTAVIECAHCEAGAVIRAHVWLTGIKKRLDDQSVSRDIVDPAFIPWFLTSYARARPIGKAHSVRFSNFVGWRRHFEALQEDGRRSHDIVVALASDDCGSISIRLETSPSEADRSIADAVDELLEAIQITSRVTTARRETRDSSSPEMDFGQFRQWVARNEGVGSTQR